MDTPPDLVIWMIKHVSVKSCMTSYEDMGTVVWIGIEDFRKEWRKKVVIFHEYGAR